MFNKKLIFIQSTYGDARQMMRYKELAKNYQESEVLAFERSYYDTTNNIKFVSLGKIDHGKYFGRILKYLKAVQIIKRNRSLILNNDIYFYGFD